MQGIEKERGESKQSVGEGGSGHKPWEKILKGIYFSCSSCLLKHIPKR